MNQKAGFDRDAIMRRCIREPITALWPKQPTGLTLSCFHRGFAQSEHIYSAEMNTVAH